MEGFDNFLISARNTGILKKVGGDLPEELLNEEEFDSSDMSDGFDSQGTRTYPTENTYHTVKNTFFGGTTTYGSDGSTYRTFENVLSRGTTTYGSDGTTYQTRKKLFGDGTVTYGSDGSKFETTSDLFGNGSTTRKK